MVDIGFKGNKGIIIVAGDKGVISTLENDPEFSWMRGGVWD